MANTLARQTKPPGHRAPQTSGLPSTHAVAQLLRAELLEVCGCTEPDAIAYAALLARRSIRAKFNFGCARVSSELPLAQTEVICMMAGVSLLLEPRLSDLRRVAKPVLTGLLAGLLLVCGALSVSYALHRSLHNDSGRSHHLCLVCMFAKGQVSAAEVTLVSALLVLCLLISLCATDPSPLSAFDYRLSPSRAPPPS